MLQTASASSPRTHFAADGRPASGRVVHRLPTWLAAAAALLVTAVAVIAADPAPATTETRRATWLWDGLLVCSMVGNLVSVIVWIRVALTRQSGSQEPTDRPRTPWATKTELDLTSGAICERVTKVESDLEDFRAAWKESQEKMAEVAEDRIVRVHDRLEKVEEKVAALPSQIVTLLLNSRQLTIGKGDR